MIAVFNESKIETAFSSIPETERTIRAGSDEHLDLIVDIQKDIENITRNTEELNSEIEEKFNYITAEQASRYVNKISEGLIVCKKLIALIKANKYIYIGVKTHLHQLILELNDLSEFINDLKNYKINNNKELNTLLDSIK